jgi:hypothetical protein
MCIKQLYLHMFYVARTFCVDFFSILLVLLGHKISAESMTYKVRIQVSILWSEVIPHAGYYAVGGRDLYASTHGGHP